MSSVDPAAVAGGSSGEETALAKAEELKNAANQFFKGMQTSLV